jgi:serine/threonine protein kinase
MILRKMNWSEHGNTTIRIFYDEFLPLLHAKKSPYLMHIVDVKRQTSASATEKSAPLLLLGERLECSLHDAMETQPSYDKKHVLHCVLKGLRDLHDLKVIHTDLSPCNIMFVRENCDDVKIIDFDLCQFGDRKPVNWLIYKMGFRPPEIYCTTRDAQFSYSADMWAFGCLVWCVYMNDQFGFPGDTKEQCFGALVTEFTNDPNWRAVLPYVLCFMFYVACFMLHVYVACIDYDLCV